MSRALRGGLPRMFRNHLNARGVWYREQYRALAQRHGPFDASLRQYAGGVAALWVEFRGDTHALEDAMLARRQGRGRRPNTQAIARLKKRAALSWGSYDQALRRLEELAKRAGDKKSPMETLASEPEVKA